MKNKRFISVIAVGALLFGTGLTSCAGETIIEEKHHYGVSINSKGEGKVTSNVKTALVNEDVVLTFEPGANHSLTSLKINGTEEVAKVQNNKLTLKMSEGGLDVLAVFDEATYKVNVGQVENGTVTSNIQEGHVGDEVTLTVTPNGGYALTAFTVNSVDKLAEVVNGVYTTTLTNTGLTVDAAFTALDIATQVKEFNDKATKAIEAEKAGIPTRVSYSDQSILTVNTTFNRYTSTEEGEYSVTKEQRFNSSNVQTVNSTTKRAKLENGTYDLVLEHDFKTGEVKNKKINNAGDKNPNVVNDGNGYLNEFFTSYGAWFSARELSNADNKNLTFTHEGSTIIISYENLKADSFNGTTDLFLRKGIFTFDGENLTKAEAIEQKYAEGSFTVGQDGKVTINPDAQPKLSKKVIEFGFEPLGAEPQEGKTPLIKNEVTSTLDYKMFELAYDEKFNEVKTEVTDTYSLTVGHNYLIELTPEVNKILDDPTHVLTPDPLEEIGTSESVIVEYSRADKNFMITPMEPFAGTLDISTINTKYTYEFVFSNAPLTSLELSGEEGATLQCDTGKSVELTLAGNDVSSNTDAAFVIEGPAAAGCKVERFESWGGAGYMFTAGDLEGEVTVKAISTLDSSIVSNSITINIKKAVALDIVANIAGTYMAHEVTSNTIQGQLILEKATATSEGYEGIWKYDGKQGNYYLYSDGMGGYTMSFQSLTIVVFSGDAIVNYTMFMAIPKAEVVYGMETIALTNIQGMAEGEVPPFENFQLAKAY